MNLDDTNQVEEFITKFGATKGRRLANQLGFFGRGAVRRANALSGYAWNKHTAIGLRKAGQIRDALFYERICDRIYSDMDFRDRW